MLRSGLYAGHGLQFDVQVAVLRFDAAAAAQLDTSSAAVLPFSPGTMGPPSGQPEMLIMPDMVWAALPQEPLRRAKIPKIVGNIFFDC